MDVFYLTKVKTSRFHRVFVFAFIFIIFLNLTSTAGSFSHAEGKKKDSCNCVIFRLDDIQDYFLNRVQIALMNLFIEKNESISLGLITNYFGNDSSILSAVRQGVGEQKFELVSHGWNHENFSKLSKDDQIDLLTKSNDKIQKVFGLRSLTFMPPTFKFNNETLGAMQDLGIKIITSDLDFYKRTNQSYLVTKIKDPKNIENDNIFHFPNTVAYSEFEPGWDPSPIVQILYLLDKSMNTYGYAVITLHPQEFAASDDGKLINAINMTKLSDLEGLMDVIKDRNLQITSFNKLIRTP